MLRTTHRRPPLTLFAIYFLLNIRTKHISLPLSLPSCPPPLFYPSAAQDSTNTRIVWLSLAEATLLISLSALQIYYIHRWFPDERSGRRAKV